MTSRTMFNTNSTRREGGRERGEGGNIEGTGGGGAIILDMIKIQ